MRQLILDILKIINLCLTAIIMASVIIAGARLASTETKVDVPTINEPQPYNPEQTCDPYTNINCGVSP